LQFSPQGSGGFTIASVMLCERAEPQYGMVRLGVVGRGNDGGVLTMALSGTM